MKTKKQEAADIRARIAHILDRWPQRRPASEGERQATLYMQQEFEALGLDSELQHFRFNESLYANLALHCGVAVAGTAVSGVAPSVGLLLHSLAFGSYYADTTRRAYMLRRLLPFKPSQNLLATVPADSTSPVGPEGKPALRVVFVAHADAAFTGWLFSPFAVKHFSKAPPKHLGFLRRSIQLISNTQAMLMGMDLVHMTLGPLAWPLRPLEVLLTVPSLIGFLVNLQVVLRNEVVPGANDDLSGVAALLEPALRLLPDKPPDVEYVFAVTGCEEASLGGADALAQEMEGRWDKGRTVVIGLDAVANGQLSYIEIEGEVVRHPIARWLREVIGEVASSEERFQGIKGFEIPVGGSDIAAFLAHGWEGVCFVAMDPELGSPGNYHQPSDNLENLNIDDIVYSVDFVEKLTRAIEARRTGRASAIPAAQTA